MVSRKDRGISKLIIRNLEKTMTPIPHNKSLKTMLRFNYYTVYY